MFIWYDNSACVEGQNITGFMVHASTRPEHYNTRPTRVVWSQELGTLTPMPV